jgi:hypothetical protein|tara:strand:+ start:6668 stop:7036 length:369 start_codon:yes stop_codon:yes gene_type:complete
MDDKVGKSLQDLEQTKKKMKDFEGVLKKIKHADEKKRILWKEIYDNALIDRQNAHILFVEAYTCMTQSASEHVSLGSTLAKYLERMGKSNEQLLKLADLISKSEAAHSAINADELFSQIQDE